MLTPYECAYASQLAYYPGQRVELNGWEKLHESPALDGEGYAGVAIVTHDHPLIPNDHRKVIIAHRGTNPELVSNIFSDAYILMGQRPPVQTRAEDFSRDVRRIAATRYDQEISFIEVGHSLGGVHAELNTLRPAFHVNTMAVTFDSPGINEEMLLPEDVRPIRAEEFPITSYLSAPNAINTVSRHFASKLIRIFTPHVREFTVSDLMGAFGHLLPFGDLKGILTTCLRDMVGVDIDYLTMVHSLENICRTFHSDVGYPVLQTQIRSWPNWAAYCNYKGIHKMGFFMRSVSIPYTYACAAVSWVPSLFFHGHDYLIQRNKRMERDLSDIPGYRLSTEWLIPPVERINPAYCDRALGVFDLFFTDASERSTLESQLGYFRAPHDDSDIRDFLTEGKAISGLRLTMSHGEE